MNKKSVLLIAILFSSISASTGSLGENMPLFSIIPFIGILLSIAIVPLMAPLFWIYALVNYNIDSYIYCHKYNNILIINNA